MEDWRGWYGTGGYDKLSEQDGEKDISEAPTETQGSIHNACKPGRPASTSSPQRKGRPTRTLMAARIFSSLGAVFYWTPPGIGLNAGQRTFSWLYRLTTRLIYCIRQVLIIISYAGLVLACIVTSAPLMTNSNRAGFLALAQLPPLILLASKNTPLSLLFGPPSSMSLDPARGYMPSGPSFAYTRLNPLHRWAGRLFILSALLHGALWINNHVIWNIPILGEQKETSGVAGLGVLGVIGLSSLRPVRKYAWGVFWWIQ
jgi:ferric-chelate reductase